MSTTETRGALRAVIRDPAMLTRFRHAVELAANQHMGEDKRHVRLDTFADGMLLVHACSDEHDVTITIPGVEDVRGGSFLAPAPRLLRLLKAMKPRALALEDVGGGSLRVADVASDGVRDFSVWQTTPLRDSFKPRESQEVVCIEVPSRSLLTGLTHTLRFASTDPMRFYLQGVLLESHEGHLRLVATDSRHLMVEDLVDSSEVPAGISVILSSGGVRRWMEALRHAGGGPVCIQAPVAAPGTDVLWSNRMVSLTIDDVLLRDATIDGRYPDYRGVIPKAHHHTLEMDRKDLIAAMRFLSTDMGPATGVAVRADVIAGRLLLSTVDHPRGSSRVDLPVDMEGDVQPFAFNFRFLMDVLRSVTVPRFRMQLTSPVEAVVCPGVDSMGVLMPIRLERTP